MKRILVAHDGSRQSEKALKEAIRLATSFGASLTVISVVPELYLTEITDIDRENLSELLIADTKSLMNRVKTSLKGKKIRQKFLIRQGSPADRIIDTAIKQKTDLIVTGSYGRHGAKRFLMGSVSSKIVDHAPCSVLVVK